MEYLVTMTTHVPDGTPDQVVDEIRAREAAQSRELAAAGHLLRLWRPPLRPGEWRSLRSGGFVTSDLERYSPQRLVLQGPLSTIRWTFAAATCSIDLYWFAPPGLQRGPGRPPCRWQHRFSLTVVGGFASRGHVFSVIAGYAASREGQLVRAALADGRTWIYQVQNGAWLFAVQRCGDFTGTALRSVQEIAAPAGPVTARLRVPAARHLPGAAGCAS